MFIFIFFIFLYINYKWIIIEKLGKYIGVLKSWWNYSLHGVKTQLYKVKGVNLREKCLW